MSCSMLLVSSRVDTSLPNPNMLDLYTINLGCVQYCKSRARFFFCFFFSKKNFATSERLLYKIRLTLISVILVEKI